MYKLLKFLMFMNLVLGTIAVLLVLSLYSVAHARTDTPSRVVEKFGREIRVMVIDTGVDYNHPKISKFIPKEYKDPNNLDYDGHGTHVVGAVVDSICDDIVIIPCRYFSSRPMYPATMRMYQCLELALKLHVDLINVSGGGTPYIEEEHTAVKKLDKAGIFIVAAAGNEWADISVEPYYPAAYYDVSNIIRVGSVGLDGQRSRSSNYGPGVIFELGEGVRSTWPGGDTGLMSGTSAATPKITNKILKYLCYGE